MILVVEDRNFVLNFEARFHRKRKLFEIGSKRLSIDIKSIPLTLIECQGECSDVFYRCKVIPLGLVDFKDSKMSV